MSKDKALCGCEYVGRGVLRHKEGCVHRPSDVKPKIPDGPPSMQLTQAKSVKHDSAKPAVQYVPKEALFAMGEAFAYGAQKYGGWNYANSGLEISRCLGAAIRHVYQYLDGENVDSESLKSHLGHAMAAIAMAIYMQENFPEKDDRHKKGTK